MAVQPENKSGSNALAADPAAAPVSPGRQLRLKMDESHLTASYANAFRTYTTPEEVIMDFGLNLITQAPREGAQPEAGELLFQLNERVIMNYMTAKRLAITVGQIVRRYEEQFGEIKLNPGERTRPPSAG